MEVIIVNDLDKITAKLVGEIDSTNVAELDAALKPLYKSEAQIIVLDCEELTYISSSGLRAFLVLQKHSIATKKDLILKSLTPEILYIFKMTGFSSIFKIE
ncbi:MAG: STAS domain-containing protein [Synergistaceae bacterium]